MNRRDFIKQSLVVVGAIGFGSLALGTNLWAGPENSFVGVGRQVSCNEKQWVKMGFVDKQILHNENQPSRFCKKHILYSKEDVYEGWLTVIQYSDEFAVKIKNKHLPIMPWHAYWTPRETGYVTDWSTSAIDESTMMRELWKKFG